MVLAMGLPRDGVVVADEGTVFGVLEGAPVEERSGQADLLPLVGFGLVVSLQHYLNLTARSGHLLPSFRLTTTNAKQMKQTENHRSGLLTGVQNRAPFIPSTFHSPNSFGSVLSSTPAHFFGEFSFWRWGQNILRKPSGSEHILIEDLQPLSSPPMQEISVLILASCFPPLLPLYLIFRPALCVGWITPVRNTLEIETNIFQILTTSLQGGCNIFASIVECSEGFLEASILALKVQVVAAALVGVSSAHILSQHRKQVPPLSIGQTLKTILKLDEEGPKLDLLLYLPSACWSRKAHECTAGLGEQVGPVGEGRVVSPEGEGRVLNLLEGHG